MPPSTRLDSWSKMPLLTGFRDTGKTATSISSVLWFCSASLHHESPVQSAFFFFDGVLGGPVRLLFIAPSKFELMEGVDANIRIVFSSLGDALLGSLCRSLISWLGTEVEGC